jgi:hypothetical protein
MPPTAPGGQQDPAIALARSRFELREQRRIGERADGNDQAVDPAAQDAGAMLRHRRLARNFGNDSRLARDEVIERFDDVYPTELRSRSLAVTGPGERAHDPHCRVGGAQRRDHVLRHAAAADEADCLHMWTTAD